MEWTACTLAMYTMVLEQHILPTNQCFLRENLVTFNKIMLNHKLNQLQKQSFIVERSSSWISQPGIYYVLYACLVWPLFHFFSWICTLSWKEGALLCCKVELAYIVWWMEVPHSWGSVELKGGGRVHWWNLVFYSAFVFPVNTQHFDIVRKRKIIRG